MFRIHYRTLLVGLMLISNVSMAQYTDSAIKVTDLLKIKKASGIKVSPDGKWAIYTVSSIDSAKSPSGSYASVNKLFKINLEGKYEQSGFSEPGENASQLSFSPDGKRIAFVKNVNGTGQIFIWEKESASVSQLTRLKSGAAAPVWSPDGTRIAFVSSFSVNDLANDVSLKGNYPEWFNQKPGLADQYRQGNAVKADPDGTPDQIRAYLAKSETLKKAKDFTRIQFQTETSTSNEIRFSHVFVIDTHPGAEPKQLTKGFNSFSSPLFADENTLYVNAKINVKHPDEELFQQIYRIDINQDAIVPFLKKDNVSFALTDISKSGKWLVYQTSVPGTVNVPLLFVKNLKQSGVKDLKIAVDRNVADVNFLEGEREIYFSVATNGADKIYTANLLTGKFSALSPSDFGISDLVIAGKGKVIFAGTNSDNPSEIYLSDLQLKKPVRITAINQHWLSSKKTAHVEKHSFVNEKGLTVEYWVVKPADFDGKKQYPLLLDIHGGPASMWGPGEASMWHEFQYFAAKGIAVVYGNPRGSSGYGQEFLAANKFDWANGPASDVLKSVELTVSEGWVNHSQLLISGGSYGGYLTSWIISHDKRFLAASAQRGVYDFKTMFGEGNVWRIIPRYYETYPWEHQKGNLLQQQSPFTYVDQITTPLLIFAGENDGRVGVAQSDMLYKALKVLNRPVEYVRQPGASHEMVRSGDPLQRIDQLLRTYEFFSRYLLK